MKPKCCRVVEHQRGLATNYLHPVNTETTRKVKRMLLDEFLGERTHRRLLRHRGTKCQYLGLDSRWQTRSNICWLESRLGGPYERPLQSGSSCAVWRGAVRESQPHNYNAAHSELNVFLLPGSLAAGMLVHPAAVRRTVRTQLFVSSSGREGWETLDALVSVCFRETSWYIQIDLLLRTTMFGTEERFLFFLTYMNHIHT